MEWASSVGLCQIQEPQHPHLVKVSPCGQEEEELTYPIGSKRRKAGSLETCLLWVLCANRPHKPCLDVSVENYFYLGVHDLA